MKNPAAQNGAPAAHQLPTLPVKPSPQHGMPATLYSDHAVQRATWRLPHLASMEALQALIWRINPALGVRRGGRGQRRQQAMLAEEVDVGGVRTLCAAALVE
jgi:hypothetical protein